MKNIFFVFLFAFPIANVFGQVSSPSPKQSQMIILKGGTIHIGNGSIIENGAVVFENGIITRVGKKTDNLIEGDKKITEINTDGKHIYPGIIALNTNLGLSEIGAVRATNDYNEVGEYNPHIRSIIAYNTDSEVTPTLPVNGVLLAQVVPQGGIINGTSSIVQLDAWNWEDAAYQLDDALFVEFPNEMNINHQTDAIVKADDFLENIDKIRQFFNEAKTYVNQPKAEVINLRFEAMRTVFSGNKKLFVRANGAKQMIQAISLFKEFNLKPVFVGGRDAYKITQVLKENGITVVLESVQKLPNSDDEDIFQPYKTPLLLQQAGVDFVISYHGFWQQRNLSYQAGEAVSYGLPKEEALKSITLNAAKAVGIDKKTGSIEVGKDANIIITAGDIFDMRSSEVIDAYIQGRKLGLKNIQKANYEKFKKKYNQN